MSVSGVAHARRASFQQSAGNDWNRMNQVTAVAPGHERPHASTRRHSDQTNTIGCELESLPHRGVGPAPLTLGEGAPIHNDKGGAGSE